MVVVSAVVRLLLLLHLMVMIDDWCANLPSPRVAARELFVTREVEIAT